MAWARSSNVEEQEIAGAKLELYIVDFEKEKLRLKVPTNRAEQKGMRHLADRPMIETAMKVIRGRARIKRTMWSRRAQEYDAKINSGDMIAVAEVIRDLYRSERQPEQSYSERQLFEQALDRIARELAAVRKVDEDQCIKELEDYLAKPTPSAKTKPRGVTRGISDQGHRARARCPFLCHSAASLIGFPSERPSLSKVSALATALPVRPMMA
jgi:CarD family transcriptional regulator